MVEHPGDDLWDSIGVASRAAMQAFPGDRADIVGVGLCTIRFCRAMVRADGSLAHPVLSWMDARVSRPYVPADFPAADRVTTSSGYITHRMTGRFVDTAANYQGMWPIDTDNWCWLPDGPAFTACGYPREMLVELVQPGEQLGTLTAQAAQHTGLPAGIPVIATANDKAVEALGSGLRRPDDVLVSLGTYIAAMATGHDNSTSATDYWTNFASVPQEYLYESHGIRRGMWTVSWVRDLLDSTEDVLNEQAADIPAGSDGLMTVLNWLAPTDAPWRKGAFLGFDGRQGKYHLYRSVLEGIAMTMFDKTNAMMTELDRPYGRLIISGGGSNSDVMMQIFADVFGRPTVRMSNNNAAGLGAAICVAAGLGIYPSFNAASEQMTTVGAEFTADPQASKVYQQLLPAYRLAHDCLEEPFKISHAAVG